MMKTIYERISKYGLVDWAVVRQGVVGIPSQLDRLPSSCVENYALLKLEEVSIDHPLLHLIANLSDSRNLSTSEIISQLEQICNVQSLNMERAMRIWRAVAVEEVIEDLDSSPVYGLIKISEFWSSWGWPSDVPSSINIHLNNLPEHDYHSDVNYKKVIREHVDWIKIEVTALKNSSNSAKN